MYSADIARFSQPKAHKRIRFVKGKAELGELSSEDLNSQSQSSQFSSVSQKEADNARSFYESILAEPSEASSPLINTEPEPEISLPKHRRTSKRTKRRRRVEEPTYIGEREVNLFLKAAAEGHKQDIERLLDLGVDLNAVDSFGWTALMCAAAEGRAEICPWLIERGINYEVVDRRGFRAGEIAARAGHARTSIAISEAIWNKARKEFESRVKQEPLDGDDTQVIEIDDDSSNFCGACRRSFTGSKEEHESSVLHQVNTSAGDIPDHSAFLIPQSNPGYRMLRRSGWDGESGLGRREQGKKYPMKTVLKRDRKGLGNKHGAARVTHFNAYDEAAVETVRKQSQFSSRREQTKKEAKERQMSMSEFGCNVCREEYSGHEETRIPRVLHGCGHTICQGCAVSILSQQTSLSPLITAANSSIPLMRVLLCPFDRLPTHTTSVLALKKNFALLEIIERLNHGGAPDSPSPGVISDRFERERRLGVECDEDACHVAVLYCTVCESSLCERCSEATHSTNVLSKHKRIPLSEKPPRSAYCHLHTSYVVEFICEEEECDEPSKLMCILCRDYGRHAGHRHVLLDKEAEEVRVRIRQCLEELTRFNDDLQRWVTDVDVAMADLSENGSSSLSDTLRQVRHHFRLQREKLHREEERALQKVEAHVRSRVDTLNRRHDVISDAIMSQASSELQRALMLDNGKLLERRNSLFEIGSAAREQGAADLAPPLSELDTALPFSFTMDNRIHIGRSVDVRVILLGIDGAGKTTALAKLKNLDTFAPPPTVEYQVDVLAFKNLKLTIWDVGGLPKLRSMWRNYYTRAQAIIYFIDASSVERFVEAESELWWASFSINELQESRRVVSDLSLPSACPIIVAVNRRQEERAPSESLDWLLRSLSESANSSRILVRHCNALTGAGLREILNDLSTRFASPPDERERPPEIPIF